MFCAISGKPPIKAVLSPNSKCIFEQHLIEQYIELKGTDPITDDPLQKTDLIEINATPQQISLSQSLSSSTIANNYSIPSLLSTLQKEWDAVMLENFELRKQLDLCKKNLSDALYRFDAVASAAAKAFVERDQLKQELAELTSAITTSNVENDGTIDKLKNSDQILSDFISELSTKSQEYVTSSKKSKKKLQHFSNVSIVQSTDFSEIDLISRNQHVNLNERSVVVKDNDKAFVFGPQDSIVDVSQATEYLVEFKGVLYTFTQGLLAAYDLHTNSLLYEEVLEGTDGPVIFMAYPHQVSDSYFLFVTERGTIYGYEVTKKALFTISGVKLNDSVQFVNNHKDGALLAIGNQNEGVHVINLLAPKNDPIKFSTAFPAKRVDFGLNGYWMFVFGDSDLNVYDLRKDPGTLAMEPLSFAQNIISVELDDTAKGFFVSMGNSQVQWYEYVKGQSFIEKSTLPIETNTAESMTLVKIDQGLFLKVISENKCITYELK
ncbi:Prp19 [Kluyveromyces lactis]|nr:Prp19 [Kluyveromyces lactis]